MKLLSICIPTYNRDKELSQLMESFLVPALDSYGHMIEIIVCDNSDADIAISNQALSDGRVKYYQNEENLGFAGNLLRCVKEATSHYIWIISDDDPIFWTGFVELIDKLPSAKDNNVDCIMLPFQTLNIFDEVDVSNRNLDWGCRSDTNIKTLLSKGRVPFVLFSSAVIKLDKTKIPELETTFFMNDYLQVIMFLKMLDADAQVNFIENITINYEPEYNCRFTIRSLFKSMYEVHEFLHEKFGLELKPKKTYGSWLLWLVHHRGGLYKFKDGDADRWHMLSQLPHYFSFKNLILACVIILPLSLIHSIYPFYHSFTVMRVKGKFTFSEFGKRVAITKKIINEND